SFRTALREGGKLIEQDKSDRLEILHELSQRCNGTTENLEGATRMYRVSAAVLNRIENDVRIYAEYDAKVPDYKDEMALHERIAGALRNGIDKILDNMSHAQA